MSGLGAGGGAAEGDGGGGLEVGAPEYIESELRRAGGPGVAKLTGGAPLEPWGAGLAWGAPVGVRGNVVPSWSSVRSGSSAAGGGGALGSRFWGDSHAPSIMDGIGTRAPAARAKASAISMADWNLPLGSRENARSKNSSILGLSVGTSSEGRRLAPVRMFDTMTAMASPGKGYSLVRARNMTAARDQRSLLASTALMFWICSGLM
jgi:hypothetical protein